MTIQEAIDRHTHELLALPNVMGVALGQKERSRKGTGRIAIGIFVTAKMSESQLAPQDIIPKVLEGYETDVEESGGPFVIQRPER